MKEHVLGRRRGQSLVEFAITLPFILVMISGLIEFGFLLNAYLDVVDVSREVARRAADGDPDRVAFYQEASDTAVQLVDEGIGQIRFNAATDDIVISAFRFDGLKVKRIPGEVGWSAFGHHGTKMHTQEVVKQLKEIRAQLSSAPDTGVVLVEVFYHYQSRLGLPWITALLGDPVELHAFSFAPNRSVDP